MRILIDGRSVRTPAGRYVFQGLARGWRAHPRVSSVIAAIPPSFEGSIVPDGVEPMRVASNNWATHLLTELPRAADRARADIIFCPNGIGPADARVVAYLQDMYHFAPTMTTSMTAQVALQRAIRLGIRTLSHRYYRVAIAVSQTIAHAARRHFSLPVEVVPNGVEVGTMRWHGGDTTIVVLGGIGARKSESTAIEGWSLVRARPHGRSLTIVGVEPRARRMKLRALARRLHVAESVSVRGTLARSRYLAKLAGCSLAVSCSTLESFGLPMAEALLLGVPVIGSDIGAHAELTARAGAGALFPVGDARALAQRFEAAVGGELPPRSTRQIAGWDWASRAAEHVDIFDRYIVGVPHPIHPLPASPNSGTS